jgi:hypothetical protein
VPAHHSYLQNPLWRPPQAGDARGSARASNNNLNFAHSKAKFRRKYGCMSATHGLKQLAG